MARLKVVRTKEPFNFTGFNLTDLYPPTKRDPDNACASIDGQDGFSVNRADGLDREEIMRRAEVYAASGKNRRGDGAYIACAEQVRSLKAEGGNDINAFVVYDDDIEINHEHAVIRGRLEVPPAQRPSLMAELQALFEETHWAPDDPHNAVIAT